MFEGNKDGIELWNKLGTSENPSTQAYFNSVRNAVQTHRSAWFSDCEEQSKKRLNNQKIYFLYWNVATNRWTIDLFHTPNNNMV